MSPETQDHFWTKADTYLMNTGVCMNDDSKAWARFRNKCHKS